VAATFGIHQLALDPARLVAIYEANEFDIYDRDLTRVEFMEFKPVKEPCHNPYTAEHPKP
jgi:hypothetical protein